VALKIRVAVVQKFTSCYHQKGTLKNLTIALMQESDGDTYLSSSDLNRFSSSIIQTAAATSAPLTLTEANKRKTNYNESLKQMSKNNVGELEAKVAIVTGGSRGIGAAIAKRLAAADAGDADSVRNAIERTVTTFGRLDVLVNNVGFFLLTSPRFEPNYLWSDRSNNRPSTKSTFYDET
jgi:hypothetical protein